MLKKAAIVKNKVAHRKLLEQVRANIARTRGNMENTRANMAHKRANMTHIKANMAHIRANMARIRQSRPDSGRVCLICAILAFVKNKVAHRKLLEQVCCRAKMSSTYKTVKARCRAHIRQSSIYKTVESICKTVEHI